MTRLLLDCVACASDRRCGLCGQTMTSTRTTLVDADRGTPVCSECGRRHSPALAALVRLAGVAERVGRMGQHTLFPPLTALLDLAQAAENYTTTVPTPGNSPPDPR